MYFSLHGNPAFFLQLRDITQEDFNKDFISTAN